MNTQLSPNRARRRAGLGATQTVALQPLVPFTNPVPVSPGDLLVIQLPPGGVTLQGSSYGVGAQWGTGGAAGSSNVTISMNGKPGFALVVWQYNGQAQPPTTVPYVAATKATAPTTAPGGSSSGGMSTGAKVAIGVGGVVVLGGIIFAIANASRKSAA